MDNREYGERPLGIYVFKGFLMAFYALIIKLLASFSCLAVYTQRGFINDLPDFVVDIVIFLASLLIYNSVFSLIMSFDRVWCEEFFMREYNEEDEKSTFRSLFGYKSFLCEFLPVVIILSIAAAFGANWEIFGMFHTSDGNSPYSLGILPFLVNLVLISLIMLYERYETVRYWKMLKKQGNLEELQSKFKIIFRVIVITFAYPLLMPYIPLLLFLILTSGNILIILFSAPVLALTFIGIVAVVILIKFLIAAKRRKSFFKATKTLVRQHGFEISNIIHPYSSLFSRKKRCTFTVKTKKDSFDCLVIGNVRRGVPICFTSHFEGYYRHQLGTKRYGIAIEKHFEYSAPGDGKKIMIINPTPKYAYICDPSLKKEKRVFNSERVWDFVAYEAEAFLAALDRGSLGKSSSVQESDDVKIPRRFMPPVDV